jgi:hypothetical protein
MPGDFRCDLTNACAHYHYLCTRAIGRIGRPAFPAPSVSRAERAGQTSRETGGEIAKACLRLFENRIHCRRRCESRDPNPRRLLGDAMTQQGRWHKPSPLVTRRPAFAGTTSCRDDEKCTRRRRCYTLAAFFRYARCTAQLQPGGWEANSLVAKSLVATSLAGTADAGARVGIASLTRRSCADWSCVGM